MKAFHTFSGLKSFLILWSSQAVSSLGSAMTSYALVLWTYSKQGTATSVALLTFFTYLPSIFFCFIAGTLADKWDKKRIMLISDLVAALGTMAVFLLHETGMLHISHLYIVNLIISCMNAFQCPASYVAVSLLAPKEQYVRVGGLQAFANSLVTVTAPALATVFLSLGGLRTIFIIDLSTFAVAFCSLAFFIRIPALPVKVQAAKEKFWKSCLAGYAYLKEHRAILNIVFFFAFINLLAYMTGFGTLPVMILKRSGNSQAALTLVSTAVGLGTLAGSILVTLLKPSKSRTKVIFGSCALSFLLCDLIWSLGRSVPIWVFAAFAGNMPLPFINANLTTLMRTNVPKELQGRVFSTRDTLQYSTIPLGLFLGGYLADNVFEPFMGLDTGLAHFFSGLVGTGSGSGIAVMFLFTGVIGLISCLIAYQNESYRVLD